MAGNTYASELTTQHLLDGCITVLQNAFAPLRAFSRTWESDPIKPRATCQAKLVTAAPATQVDPTDFETGDSTIDHIAVVVHQLTQSFGVSNADLQGGLRLQDLVFANAKKLGEAVMDAALTPVTTANFGAATITRSSAAFTFSDMATLWGALKKSNVKNCILDGEYLARLINQPVFYQVTSDQPGAGWKAFGWDFVGCNTRWDGAEAKVVGFACNPQAIATVAGLPLETGNPTLERRILNLPDLDIKVAYHVWLSLASRSLRASFDLMFGSALGDATAGKLVMSP
jgi:hypothetical protein